MARSACAFEATDCADGTRIDGYTQVYGWDFASETCAAPKAITLREPIHAIESPPYPIAPGATALHFHLVPRWEGDHNFMTVCAEIRTIPQHIERTFDMLLPDFSALTMVEP